MSVTDRMYHCKWEEGLRGTVGAVQRKNKGDKSVQGQSCLFFCGTEMIADINNEHILMQ